MLSIYCVILFVKRLSVECFPKSRVPVTRRLPTYLESGGKHSEKFTCWTFVTQCGAWRGRLLMFNEHISGEMFAPYLLPTYPSIQCKQNLISNGWDLRTTLHIYEYRPEMEQRLHQSSHQSVFDTGFFYFLFSFDFSQVKDVSQKPLLYNYTIQISILFSNSKYAFIVCFCCIIIK